MVAYILLQTLLAAKEWKLKVETRDVDTTSPLAQNFRRPSLTAGYVVLYLAFYEVVKPRPVAVVTAAEAAHISGPGRISKRKARCALSKSQPNEASAAAAAAAAAIKASAGGSEEEPTRAFFLSDCSRGSCV